MLLFTKTINDSVRGDAEQPRRHLLDRPRLNQRVEHILQHVFGIGRVRHALADEVAESSALPLERLFDAQYSVHLPPRRAGVPPALHCQDGSASEIFWAERARSAKKLPITVSHFSGMPAKRYRKMTDSTTGDKC